MTKKQPMVVCNWCNWIGEVDDLEQMQCQDFYDLCTDTSKGWSLNDEACEMHRKNGTIEQTFKCCPMICHEQTPEHPANKPPFDPDACLMDKPGLRHTIILAQKWWGYWCAINSGNYAIGNSDHRALAKDNDEMFAHGKEHGTLRHALQTLLDRAEQENSPYSEVRALTLFVEQIISEK
jgi:hypothetical protein